MYSNISHILLYYLPSKQNTHTREGKRNLLQTQGHCLKKPQDSSVSHHTNELKEDSGSFLIGCVPGTLPRMEPEMWGMLVTVQWSISQLGPP